jgi:hypothetical protein
MAQVSIVKATKEYFESQPHGRKVEVQEFKALSHEDRVEMRDMLIKAGYDVAPLKTA